MAKKSRRARRRRAARKSAEPRTAPTPAREKRAEAAGPARGTTIDFAQQYGYVYDDLKRIAILAGTMFAILIALSFVIR